MFDNYMTQQELSNIMYAINALSRVPAPCEVGFRVEAFDSNGDTLGFIDLGDNLEYCFYPVTTESGE